MAGLDDGGIEDRRRQRKPDTAMYIGAVARSLITVSDRMPPVMNRMSKARSGATEREIFSPKMNQMPISAAMKTS